MALNKYLQESDRIADLYRAAYYLAKGSKNIAKIFLKKSGKNFDYIKTATKKQRLFWAEKILDEYTMLKYF